MPIDEEKISVKGPPVLPTLGTKGNAEQKGTLDQEVARIRDMMQYIVIVLFIAVASVIIAVFLFVAQAIHEKASSYNNLRDKVFETNIKIINLENEINKLNQKK